MLNEDLIIVKKEKAEYPPIPENVYQVELLDVTSETKPTFQTKNKPDAEKEYEELLKFQFTLLSGTEDGKSLRGRNIWRNYVPSYLYIGKDGKNALYQIIEAILGRELTQEEIAKGISGGQINKLIGKQCRIVVKNKKSEKDGTVYSNIDNFLKTDAYLTALTAEEKEKATVKDKEESIEAESYPQAGHLEDPALEEQALAALDEKLNNIPF